MINYLHTFLGGRETDKSHIQHSTTEREKSPTLQSAAHSIISIVKMHGASRNIPAPFSELFNKFIEVLYSSVIMCCAIHLNIPFSLAARMALHAFFHFVLEQYAKICESASTHIFNSMPEGMLASMA